MPQNCTHSCGDGDCECTHDCAAEQFDCCGHTHDVECCSHPFPVQHHCSNAGCNNTSRNYSAGRQVRGDDAGPCFTACAHEHGGCCAHECGPQCCSHEHDGDCDSPIHGASYLPRLNFYGTGPLFFGVELEMEAPTLSVMTAAARTVAADPFWFCKHDGSLNRGFEAVSHPASIEYWRSKNLAILFSDLASRGMRSYQTSTAGMHIHASRAALSMTTQVKLVRLIDSNENFVFRISRRGSRERLDRWAAVHPGTMRKYIRKVRYGDQEGRYAALNCMPENTVEFRFFRGTLHEQSFRRNLELVNALIEWARESSLPQAKDAKNFVSWLDGPHAERKLGSGATRLLVPWIRGDSYTIAEV